MSSDCRCAAIMAADPSRHFKGCPERVAHPDVEGPSVPFGDSGEDERLGFPLELDVLMCEAECGSCGGTMEKGDPFFGYRLGPVGEFGVRPGDCCLRGTRCMECVLGALARLRTRMLAGEFEQELMR